MANTLTAIETQYAGYRFRSRLEARWAVFFTAMGWKWRYEDEGYDLGEAGRYLPDFKIEDRLFVEVKPNLDALDDRTDSVCNALRAQAVAPVWVLVGLPGESRIYTMHPPGHEALFGISRHQAARWLVACQWCRGPVALRSIRFCEWETACRDECPSIAVDGALTAASKQIPIVGARGGLHPPEWFREIVEILATARSSAAPLPPDERYESAVSAARSARFEHGEAG